MATKKIVIASVLAAIVNGLLAGGNVDRAIVARAAWSRVGVVAWADYSRQADLGSGRLFYPAMAFVGTLLCIASVILLLCNGRFQWRSALPVLLAAGLMVASLPISFKAAPFILSLRHLEDNNITAIKQAFEGSYFWGRFQMSLHVLGFLANLWSIAALSRSQMPVD
ncbi:MAG: hypothetical protein P4L46_11525 [Fimbriimonas sp.]|nr:hypothetical protein [Fimbriimonas sp.]